MRLTMQDSVLSLRRRGSARLLIVLTHARDRAPWEAHCLHPA